MSTFECAGLAWDEVAPSLASLLVSCRTAAVDGILILAWTTRQQDDLQHLAEVAQRLRSGRKRLAMTIYAIQRGRRTPEQVAAVVDRASRVIHRNKLVRLRGCPRIAVH